MALFRSSENSQQEFDPKAIAKVRDEIIKLKRLSNTVIKGGQEPPIAWDTWNAAMSRFDNVTLRAAQNEPVSLSEYKSILSDLRQSLRSE